MGREREAEEFCSRRGLSLSLQTGIALDSPEDYGRYLLTFDGTITSWDAEEEQDEGLEVGRFKAHLLRVDAADGDGWPADIVFDSYTQGIYEAFVELFDPETCEFLPHVKPLVGEFVCTRDVLYLESIELLPGYRGHGAGAVVTRRFLEAYCPLFPLALMRPYAIHSKDREWSSFLSDEAWFGQMDYGSFLADDPTAASKLVAYWGQLGFRPIPGSDYLIWTHFPEGHEPGGL